MSIQNDGNVTCGLINWEEVEVIAASMKTPSLAEINHLMCHRCEKMFPPDRTFHCSDCGLLICGNCSEWIELGEPEQDIPTGKTRAIQAGKVRVCRVCIEDDGITCPECGAVEHMGPCL